MKNLIIETINSELEKQIISENQEYLVWADGSEITDLSDFGIIYRPSSQGGAGCFILEHKKDDFRILDIIVPGIYEGKIYVSFEFNGALPTMVDYWIEDSDQNLVSIMRRTCDQNDFQEIIEMSSEKVIRDEEYLNEAYVIDNSKFGTPFKFNDFD